MNAPNFIKPLLDAFAGEKSAAEMLQAARAKREAAEAVQAEWDKRREAFHLLHRSQELARTRPLAFVAANDNEEFTPRELRLIQNVQEIEEGFARLLNDIVTTLSLTRQDGKSEPLFGDIARVRAVLETIREVPAFVELKAKAEAHAGKRALEFAKTLQNDAKELAAWGKSNGVPAAELAAFQNFTI